MPYHSALIWIVAPDARCSLRFDRTATIASIKVEASAALGRRVSRLFFADHHLEDDEPLAAYDIQPGDELEAFYSRPRVLRRPASRPTSSA